MTRTADTGELPAGADIVAFHQACLALPHWLRDQPPEQPQERPRNHPADRQRVDAHKQPADSAPPSGPGDAKRPQDAPAEHGGTAGLWHWVEVNHRCNSLLWAEEDLARRTKVSDAEIAANKRNIDRYNQARNDATERVDELLLVALGLVDEGSAVGDAPVSTPAPGARLNSETAGSMIDRLSIMSLKVHAMRLQTLRKEAGEAHRQASRVKLERLQVQRDDLAACLDELLAASREGRAYFKVYRQFKMYNDARFNPVLIAEAGVVRRNARR